MSSPDHFKKLSVVKLTNDFREATKFVDDAALPRDGPSAGEVYVRVVYCGINASDLNFTKGSYFPKAATPFDCGFEGLGEVIRLHPDDQKNALGLREGSVVVFSENGTFAEYMKVPLAVCVPVDKADPSYLVLNVSGLTAAVSLGELAATELSRKKGNRVALVTAAAGGTGQMAVQLLKQLYGCRVVGTCSNEEKARYLKEELGCDEVINYKTALASHTLDAEFDRVAPEGFDVVYECVGGEMFNTAVRHVAVHGVVIVIGAISGYQGGQAVGWSHPHNIPLPTLLLKQSASLKGFFLPNHRSRIPHYMKELLTLYKESKLKAPVDRTKSFHGVEQIADALDHLYTGESYGKVVVKLSE